MHGLLAGRRGGEARSVASFLRLPGSQGVDQRRDHIPEGVCVRLLAQPLPELLSELDDLSLVDVAAAVCRPSYARGAVVADVNAVLRG